MKRSVAVLAVLVVLSSLVILVHRALVAPEAARVPAPLIISKREWAPMREGKFWSDQPFDPYSQGPLGDPAAITIHHSSLAPRTDPPGRKTDREKLRDMQLAHVSKGWGDVGYHFFIGSDGSVYEGRPLGYAGTHTLPNHGNIGVCIIGDFQERDYPSEAQLASLARLISWLCDRFDIDPAETVTLADQDNLAVCGHRDWNEKTLCPGDRLYAFLPSLRERIRGELLEWAPASNSRVAVTQFLPRTLVAGRQYELPFTVRNTGRVRWSHSNGVVLESCVPDVLSIAEPTLEDGETVGPLCSRSWQVKINAPSKPGSQRLALQMVEAKGRFGPKLSWDARVLSPDDFISQWIVAGPFPAATPDAAYATDFFASEPLDTLEIMDADDESAHGYALTGEYGSGERNYRGEDGEWVLDSGRCYRGEESFHLSLAGFKGGDLVLRRRIDAGVRDQAADVYVDDKWLSRWQSRGVERYRRWKDMDLVVPAHYVRGKDSMGVRVESVGTKQWGCMSFRYTLLDSAEPLVSPKAGDKAGEHTWRLWRSDAGAVELASVLPGVDGGAIYLAVYVKSPSAMRAEIRIGYTGYVKAWMNGEQVLAGKAEVPNFPDTMCGEVLVKKDWNRLLLKVVLEPGVTDLYVRLCDREGEQLGGLIFDSRR